MAQAAVSCVRPRHPESSARRPQLPAPSKPIWARIAVVVCTLVLFLVLAEAVVRTWPPIPTDQLLPFPYNVERVRRIANGDASLRFDSDLGWIPTPALVRREDGAVYRNNHQALRADREYDLAPPPRIQRIAAFGDSFTYCAEVTQGDCWVARLEREWADTEIMNFGVSGYGPDQAWLRYQRDGRPFHPCAVLIGYYVEDIDRVVNRFRAFIDPNESVVLSKPRYLLEGDALTLLPNPTTDPQELIDPRHVEAALGDRDSWYFPGIYVTGRFDNLSLVRLARTAAFRQTRAAMVRSYNRYPFYEEQGEAYQVAGRILIQFAEQVRADGASPVVIVFPGQRDLADLQHGAPSYATFVDWIGRAGVPTIDLTEVMAEETEQRGIRDVYGDTHFSSSSNRVVAQHLAQMVPSMVSSTCGAD